MIYYRLTGEFSGPLMRVLYLIFVLCVGALVWAAVAVARHIRRHDGDAPKIPVKPVRELLADDRKILVGANKTHGD